MEFEGRLNQYLNQARKVSTHQSIAYHFLRFIQDEFESAESGHANDLFPYLEQYLKRTDTKGTVAVKGRADALLGNLIIEFKTNFEEEFEDAKSQLKKYISVIWDQEGEVKYLLLASDGIRNVVFRPKKEKTDGGIDVENIDLERIDEIVLSQEDPEYVRAWLDRYILYKDLQTPTAEKIIDAFGKESPFYKVIMDLLEDKWEEINTESEIQVIFKQWKNYLEIVYGESFGDDLFLRHTYLASLAKMMAYIFYSEGGIPGKKERIKVLSGEAFKEWGLQNLFEEDFFSWVARVGKDFCGEFSRNIAKQLNSFDLRKLEEDVLKDLYQELVDPEERHDLGEYYTPDWLADYILEGKDPEGSFLDPACGSGTFLASAIRYKKGELNKEEPELLNHIFSSVTGIDIHPLAVITSKVNYLLATGDLMHSRKGEVHIPIYFADSIQLPEYKEEDLADAASYKFNAEGKELRIPVKFIEPPMINRLLEVVKTSLSSSSGDLKTLLSREFSEAITDQEYSTINQLVGKLEDLERQGKDTI